MNKLSPEVAQAKAKELFLTSKGQMPNKEMARLVGRDPAQITRWKEKGEWDKDLADHAIESMVGLDLTEATKLLDKIKWASPEPLAMEEVNEIMTVIYKCFLRQLLEKSIYGSINITNFYQADQFMARIEATIRRLQGEPDATIKHTHEISELPGSERDEDFIIEGIKRMKKLAQQHRLRGLQSEEDNVNVHLIEDKETIIEAEVVETE